MKIKVASMVVVLVFFASACYAATLWFVEASEYEFGKQAIPAHFKVQVGAGGSIKKILPTTTQTGVYPSYEVTQFAGKGTKKIRMRACNAKDLCSAWSEWFSFTIRTDDVPDNLVLKKKVVPDKEE